MLSRKIDQTVYYWAHDIRIHSITRADDGAVSGEIRVRGGWTPAPGQIKPVEEVVTDLSLTDFAVSVGAKLGVSPMAVIDAISGTIEFPITPTIE